ncbi:MAG: hypothetical protein RBS57_09190 [Desulforhabdus sp.]|jgi:hypothetical protein|nr:hypothetical protein [Desulforhabdus sp.]
MNRSRIKHLLFAGAAALLLALTTPLIAGSANAFYSEETTTVVPVHGYVRHEYYQDRTVVRPDTYVVYREVQRPRVVHEYHRPTTVVERDGPVVHREYRYHEPVGPGVRLKVPLVDFRLGY